MAKYKKLFIMVGLLLFLFFISILSLQTGEIKFTFKKLITFILEKDKSTHFNLEKSILFQIRIPRVLLAIAVGGALGLSGVILQGIFNNPLVEPYTLGISGGAAVAISISKLLFSEISYLSVISGFIGAALVIIFLYMICIKGKDWNSEKILLIGVMLSFICSSIVMLILSMVESETLHNIIYWIMGNLQQENVFLIKVITIISFLLLLISTLFWKELNSFVLGDEGAVSVGINVSDAKKKLFLISCILTGCSVAVAGVIGFVGLVIPHIMRLIIGRDHRFLLLASFIGGAIFLVGCDIIARTIISPLELPVGVISGMIGGLTFIYIFLRRAS